MATSAPAIPEGDGPSPYASLPPQQVLGPSGVTGQALEPFISYGRLLRVGAVVAVLVALLDGAVYLRLGSWPHLIFALKAVGALVTVLFAIRALEKGRRELAVAVPLVYLMLTAPLGPFYIEWRILVSMTLPFIVMAVAVNYASTRVVPYYAFGAWLTAVVVFILWQWHVVSRGGTTWVMASITVTTAAMLVAFAFYAFTRYAVRLEGAFQGARSANKDLSQAHERLKNVDSARVSFINSAAHELNTPLTPIRIQLELLRRAVAKEDIEAAGRSAVVLGRNFDRLCTLVGDLLDGARLDAGKLKIVMYRFDLSHMIKEALAEYRGAAQEVGVALVEEIDDDLYVEGDPVRLRQVLDNLLTNALKFTPRGGTVEVRCLPDGDHVRLWVRDTGIGMSKEALGSLFHPFRQVHDVEKTGTQGSGLGLYITKGIVTRHGGRIWAESDGVDAGAKFIVDLTLSVDPEGGPGGQVEAESEQGMQVGVP